MSDIKKMRISILANKINSCLKKKEWKSMNLCIKTIQSIKVSVYIFVYKKEIKLRIYHDTILSDNENIEFHELYDGNNYNVNNYDEIEKAIVNMIEEIKNMKFSKLHGVFKRKTNDEDDELFYEMFNVENVEMEYDMCCVCHENTFTKTSCNHTLCIVCMQSLKEKKKTDKCPICREKNLNTDNKNNDDESDDD